MADIIIIGAGPAGCAAALATARAGCKTLVFDKGVQCGALGAQARVFDFPGVADQLTGESLVKRLRYQAREAGAEIRDQEISSVALANSGRILFTSDGKRFEAKAVILASGCGKPTSLLPGEAEFWGKGVAYNVARDAALAVQSPTVVFGKTLEVATSALMLANLAPSVHVIVPATKLDLPDTLTQALKNASNVHVMTSTSLKEIRGQSGHVSEVVLLSGGQEKTLPAKAVFLCHHPVHADTAYLAGTVETGPQGMVLVNDEMATSIPGVFACGDCIAGIAQLPMIAMAQGAIAGMSAAKSMTR